MLRLGSSAFDAQKMRKGKITGSEEKEDHRESRGHLSQGNTGTVKKKMYREENGETHRHYIYPRDPKIKDDRLQRRKRR